MVRLATILTIALASQLRAQLLIGTVRDSASHESIAGAVVSILDTASHVTRQVLTRTDGGFRVTVDASSALVHVVRIGFRPVSRPLSVRGTSDQHLDIAMEPLPAILGAVRIVDQGRCDSQGDRAATLAAWEQAREAFLASVVARNASTGAMRILEYNRILDGDRIVSQSVVDSAVVGAEGQESPRTATEFAELGYVEDRPQGRRYIAPDADVLLDEAFMLNHCFGIEKDERGHPGQIGLSFRPAPGGRSKTDISGTLWVDADHPALRTLDFTYTGIEPQAMQVHAGGSLLFHEMANGVVAIQRWNLHIPELEHKLSFGADADGQIHGSPTAHVIGMRDIGGDLAAAAWPDGTTFHDTLSTISGHVTSVDGGQPLPGMSVHLRDTNIGTRTDSTGHFVFANVLPGPYVVQAADTEFAEFGIADIGGQKVSVERGATAEIDVSVRTRAAMIAELCKARGQGDASRMLIEEFYLPSGEEAGRVKFRARWGENRRTISGETDSTGAFVLCGVPSRVPIAITASRDSLTSRDTLVTVDAHTDITTARIALFAPGSGSALAYHRRLLTVVDAESSVPIAGVDVADLSSGAILGRTSASGTVSLAALAPGTSLLQLRKIGLVPRTFQVNIDPSDTLPLRVSLNSTAQLPALATSATRLSVAAHRLDGFTARQSAGFGHFLRPQDFDAARGRSLGELLVRLGVSLRPYYFGRTLIDVISDAHSSKVCPVTIYVDNVLFYQFDPTQTAIAPPDLWSISSDDYVAAEYYASPAEMPPEYNGTGSGCGLLLLWTPA